MNSKEFLASLFEQLRPGVFERLEKRVEVRLRTEIQWPTSPSQLTSTIGLHLLPGYPQDLAFARCVDWLDAEYGEQGHLSFLIESRCFPDEAKLKGLASAGRAFANELRRQHIEAVFAHYHALNFRERYGVLETFVTQCAASVCKEFPGESLRVLVPAFPTLVLERVATQATFNWHTPALEGLALSGSERCALK